MTDEVLRDDDAPLGTDSAFWYDPHTLPQYDLLVRDGQVTQAEAERHRRGRAEMGLPMTFAELRPRPDRRFAWLLQVGGPSIAGDGDSVELDGQRWQGRAWGTTDDRPGTLNFYDVCGVDGYLHRELSRSTLQEKAGVRWEATYKVPDAKAVYARVHGVATSFGEALAAVRAVDFQAVQSWGGHTWYPNARGWLAVVDGNTATLTRWDTVDAALTWRWELAPPENSVLSRIAELFGDYRLAGNATTQEAALSTMLGAQARLHVLAAELLEAKDLASAFECGRRTGRAELKAQVFGLLP